MKFIIALILITINFSIGFAQTEKKDLNAKENFAIHCANCHGKEGKKSALMVFVKDLRKSKLTNEADYFNIIYNGKLGMPKWKDKLSIQEIKELVSYVKNFKTEYNN